MQTLSFNGEPTELENILALDELQSKTIVAIRFERWTGWEGEPGNSPIIDNGGRIDIDVVNAQIPVIFKTEIHATDFFVSSSDIKNDPLEALAESLTETKKGKGEPKSLDLIARSNALALEHAMKEIDKLRLDVEHAMKEIESLKKQIKK